MHCRSGETTKYRKNGSGDSKWIGRTERGVGINEFNRKYSEKKERYKI